MPAATVGSIDALLADDPSTLAGDDLKVRLVELGRARARLDAAESATLAAFEQRAVFLSDGMTDTRAWLAHHTGIARALAGSRVTLAKRLRRMPITFDALAAGLVTASHAQVMRRCLTPRTIDAFARDETMLVEHAIALEADDFDHVISRWLEHHDTDGPDPGPQRPSELHISPLLNGRSRIDGELDLEDNAEVMAELETIADDLWRADQAADHSDPHKHRTRSQRHAAALVEMAHRSSAAGDRDHDPLDSDSDSDGDAGAPAARSRRSPRRPTLVTIVELDPLAQRYTGTATLDNGTPLPQTILQRWACNSAIGRVVMAGTSQPINLGRLTYTPSAAQRRALTARDHGCIIPGCKRKPRWCEPHHVQPWPAGPTDMANLVLLCKRHHKLVHTHTITLHPEPHTGHWIPCRPDGTPLHQRPPPSNAA